ncbi:hypothetical protein D3C73_1318770 [compost metagenome]
MHRQVGPHQLQGFRGQARFRQIGVNEAGGGGSASGQLADPRAQACGGMALSGQFQQWLAVVQAGVARVGIALAQQRQVVARAAARVQHGLRLHADVLQAAQHAARHFAIKELGVGQVATAGELPGYVGADDGKSG